MQINDAASVLRSPKRLKILEEIAKFPFVGYNVLHENTGIPDSEIYKHLHILERHKLIKHIQGKWVISKRGLSFLRRIKVLEVKNNSD